MSDPPNDISEATVVSDLLTHQSNLCGPPDKEYGLVLTTPGRPKMRKKSEISSESENEGGCFDVKY